MRMVKDWSGVGLGLACHRFELRQSLVGKGSAVGLEVV